MIKIIINLDGYLKFKYPSNILELNYSKPVTIHQILEDAKISSIDVSFIKVGDKIVKEECLLGGFTEVKLFPIIGGG
jgi:hypothetical protein